MSKTALYTGIKTELEACSWVDSTGATRRFHKVGLWRNNINREENGDLSFKLPAAFIEFLVTDYAESSSLGYQTIRMTARIHYIFETTKAEDLDILSCTQAGYSSLQYKQWGYWGKMKRRNEEQSFDHDSIQDFIQDYDCGEGKDFVSDKRPTTDATITTIDLDITKVTEL